MFTHILLCTHGTPGARLAERWVFEKLHPGFPEARISILTIINQDWSLMTGDDWLNSSATRNAFRHHVDRQLADEIETDWDRIRAAYPDARGCRFKRFFGPIEETIVNAAQGTKCDLIVIGPYQKKQGQGFKARVANNVLHPLLPVPLMVAPGVVNGRGD